MSRPVLEDLGKGLHDAGTRMHLAGVLLDIQRNHAELAEGRCRNVHRFTARAPGAAQLALGEIAIELGAADAGRVDELERNPTREGLGRDGIQLRRLDLLRLDARLLVRLQRAEVLDVQDRTLPVLLLLPHGLHAHADLDVLRIDLANSVTEPHLLEGAVDRDHREDIDLAIGQHGRVPVDVGPREGLYRSRILHLDIVVHGV